MTWRADWASLSFMHLSFLSPPLPLSPTHPLSLRRRLPPSLSPCAGAARPAPRHQLAAVLRLRPRRRCAPPSHSLPRPATALAVAPRTHPRRRAPPPSSPPRPTSVLAAAPLHHPCRGAPPPSLPRHPPWCAAARGFRRRQGQRERRRGRGGRRACPVGLEGACMRPRSSVPAGPTRGQGGGGRRPAPHRSPTRWPPASTRERACGGAGRARPSSQSRAAPVPLPRAPPPRVETGLPGPIELRARPSSAVGPWRGSSSRRHSSLRSMAAAAMAYARAGPWHGGGLPAPVLPPDPVLSVRRRASSRTSYQRGWRGAGWRLQRVPRARGYPGGGGHAEQRRPLAAELVGRAEPRGRPPSLERRCPLAAELACRAGPRSSPDERSRLAPMSGGRRKSGA